MPTINSNIAALIAHHGLLRANADLSVRLERISTGLRINRASEDPVGLVKADRLSMELAGLRAAVDAATRGSSMVSAIDGQLASIADRLETLKALVAEQGDAEGMTSEERQLAIDAELAGIVAIANTAIYGGQRLLDGSLDYQLNQFDQSKIAAVEIHGADLAPGTINLSLVVTAGAERGVLYAETDGGSFVAGELNEAVTLEITGPRGVSVLDFALGTPVATIVTAINQVRDQTGIEASITAPGGTQALTFSTIDYGSDQTVKVVPISGTGGGWATAAGVGGVATNTDTGLDAQGTANGIPWVADGLRVRFSAPMVSFSAVLTEGWASVPAQPSATIQVRGGGVGFQVGQGSTSNDRVTFGVRSVMPSQLGRTTAYNRDTLVLSMLGSGQSLAIGSGDPNDAVVVVESAIREISGIRSRLGNLDRTRLQGAMESLQSAIEAATAGEIAIREADVAAETSALVRAQILSEASISMIGAANQQAEALLRLLNR